MKNHIKEMRLFVTECEREFLGGNIELAKVALIELEYEITVALNVLNEATQKSPKY